MNKEKIYSYIPIILILLVSVFFLYKTYNYFGEYREEIALNIYNYSNYTSTLKDNIETKYYNKNYKKNLPLKLRDYYITASYKSYLATGSSYSVPSVDTLKNIIKKGARFIHLDVYSNGQILEPSTKPIVRDKTLLPKYGHSVDLSDCLSAISSLAWKNTSAPLLLYLETHFYNTDKPLCNKIVSQINKYFSSRLLDRRYSHNSKNISNINIKDALNKIIIITNRNDYLGDLSEYINGVIPSYSSDSTESDDEYYSLTQMSPDKKEKIKNQLIVYNYYPDMDAYGGLTSRYNDVDNIIDTSKLELSISRPVLTFRLENLVNPVADIFNINPTTSYDNGIQLVCMNYQYFDENMKKYLEFFKDGSMKVKPDNLRYIPKPPVEIVEQKVDLSYAPRQITTKGNWKNFYF